MDFFIGRDKRFSTIERILIIFLNLIFYYLFKYQLIFKLVYIFEINPPISKAKPYLPIYINFVKVNLGWPNLIQEI